jgi:crotonobetainyl-CoA:carnitine CoA-transferase CaiB-like acyl-CoA transferase
MVAVHQILESPMPSEAAQRPGPLSGLRIVDLTQFILGPYATQTLGDLGADVIKVEGVEGDRQRRETGKIAPAKDLSAVFLQLNRNKRSVVLDLKTASGCEDLRRLIATADVFVHNMRPEAMARLGFGYDEVRALNPAIVYAAAVGYGAGGEYAGRQAFDDLIQGASGATALLPLYDGDPTPRPLPAYVADKVCGLFLAIGLLAAVQHRAATGEGQYVEIPMFETFTGFLLAEQLHGHAYSPPRGKIGSPGATTPFRKALKTRDGFIMMLAQDVAASDRFLRLGGVSAEEVQRRYGAAADGRGRLAAYHAMLGEAAAMRTTADWLACGDRENVPIMRVNGLEDLRNDPHLSAVGFFEERELADDGGRYLALRPAFEFSATPAGIRRDPPRLGQHTQEVLGEIQVRAQDPRSVS